MIFTNDLISSLRNLKGKV